MVGYARSAVDGRSAREVLSVVKDERKKADQQALAIYREKLTEAQKALGRVEPSERERAEQ